MRIILSKAPTGDQVYRNAEAYEGGGICYISHYGLVGMRADGFLAAGNGPFEYLINDDVIERLVKGGTVWTRDSIKNEVRAFLDRFVSQNAGWTYDGGHVDAITRFVFDNVTWEDVTTLLRRVNPIGFLTGDETVERLTRFYV